MNKLKLKKGRGLKLGMNKGNMRGNRGSKNRRENKKNGAKKCKMEKREAEIGESSEM